MPSGTGRVNRNRRSAGQPYNAGMATHADVAVVGGGIIGLTTAYFLARSGLTVEVFERGEPGREASWAGAGIVPPGNPAHAATPVDRLRAIGSEAFPGFSAELRERTGVDNGYLRCGAVEFFDEATAAAVLPLWRAERIRFEPLAPEFFSELGLPRELADRQPGPAFVLPDCAQVRNPWHLRALEAACRLQGVRIRAGVEVTAWAASRGIVRGVCLASGETVAAGACLLAGGAWSEPLLRQLGRQPGVHPVRGQIVLLNNPRPRIRPVLMFGKRYIVPRGDGRVLVGATEEPQAGFAKYPTPGGVAELIAFASSVFPEWASAELERAWAGLRPGSPDGLPFIGPVPGWEGVYVATGHFRAGVQLSLGTARLVTELLTGRPPCVPPHAFALDRVPQMTAMRAFRS